MSAPQFTPGPYRIEEEAEGEYLIVGRPTWNCRRFGVYGEWDVAKIDDLLGDRPEEVLANARLFSMADQLFAFVERAANRNPVFAKGADKDLIAEARALVAQVVQP